MAARSKAAPKRAKGFTKAQLTSELATKTGLQKSQVGAVMDSLVEVLQSELKGGRPVTVAGIIKVTVVHKKATSARLGRNPSSGETITIKAKPARKVVKVRALKGLKDMA